MKDKKSPAQYNRSSAIVAWLCVAGSIATAVIVYCNEGRLPSLPSILVILALIVLAVAATVSAWRTRKDTTPLEYEVDPTHPSLLWKKQKNSQDDTAPTDEKKKRDDR